LPAVPVIQLQTDRTERVPKFAIVGNYVEQTASSFVKHVALLRSEEELHYAASGVRVWHMGPPLVAGEIARTLVESDSTCVVHLIGVVDLDSYEVEGIETWLAEVDKEKRPYGWGVAVHQYIVNPPVKWHEGETGIRLYRRFSCVGFVLECYRSVGIILIDESSHENVPEVALETVVSAYGPTLQSDKLRLKMGLEGAGPWRIVLGGYLFHSLARTTDDIRRSPHIPISADEKDFPVATETENLRI
jgi:hypothetical protein